MDVLVLLLYLSHHSTAISLPHLYICVYVILGRRMCLGESLVKAELFIFLANLLHKFSVKFPEDQPDPSVVPGGGMIQYPEPFKAIFVPRE